MSASVIRSPSRVSLIRNTPCVLGCCGPTLTTNGSVFIAMGEPLPSSQAPTPANQRTSKLPLATGLLVCWCALSPPLPPPLKRPAGLPREPLQPRHLPAREVQPVLAQRVAGEAVPEEDTPQVRVALEPDAHQGERLALLEVGAPPHRHHRRHRRVLAVAGPHLDRRRLIEGD